MSRARRYFQPDVLEMLDGLGPPRTYADFEPYQRRISGIMERQEAVIVGTFMGSGKTAMALRAFWALRRKGTVRKGLVVGPLNVIKDTWPDEMVVWDFSRELTYSVIAGDEEQRRQALAQDTDLYFVNRENLVWLYQTEGLARWRFDALIYDEATRMKEGRAKTRTIRDASGIVVRRGRMSEFGVLAKTRRKFKRRWLLTGTPAPTGLLGLWGPMYVADGGARLGRTKTDFEDRWFTVNRYTQAREARQGAFEEITAAMAGVMYCLKEQDYLKVPPPKFLNTWVRLDPKQQRAYRVFQKTLELEEHGVTAANSAVLCNKLLQFANGSVYAEEDENPDDEFDLRTKPVAKWIHDHKLDALGALLEEYKDECVLIAYSFKFDLHAIVTKYPFVKIFGQDPNDLSNWNTRKYRAMILHPASAGHGLNFQKGGRIAVQYGLNWSLELDQQFCKRLSRRGQAAKEVRIYRILARGTEDERVLERLAERAETQDTIVRPFLIRPQDPE